MWMTIDETANYLRVSKETIYRLAQKSEIPASKIGNQWRFKREAVDSWFASRGSHRRSSDESSAPAGPLSAGKGSNA